MVHQFATQTKNALSLKHFNRSNENQ